MQKNWLYIRYKIHEWLSNTSVIPPTIYDIYVPTNSDTQRFGIETVPLVSSKPVHMVKENTLPLPYFWLNHSVHKHMQGN